MLLWVENIGKMQHVKRDEVKVAALYLYLVIMVVLLDGTLPRLCGNAGGVPYGETIHSAYDEPRPVVHNVPPGYESSTLPIPPPPFQRQPQMG